MDGLVYIIVPAYNSESYIKRCLDSLFSQTYKNIKIIVINDGSSDNTSTVLEEYSNQHNNIIVINQDNKGLSGARNSGLNIIPFSEESFITFVDSDDYIEPDYIEKMIHILRENSCDIVCTSFVGFTNDSFDYTSYVEKIYEYDRVTAIQKLFCGDITSHSQMKLYRSDLWKNIRFDENTKFMEDQKITFKLFYSSNKIIYYTYPGYKYYYSPNSLCRSSFNNKKVLDGLEAYYEAINYHYDNDDRVFILKYAKMAYSSAFLMLYPRFNCSRTSKEELELYKKHLRFVKNNRLIKQVEFVRDKDKKKQKLYNLSPIIYKLFYKFYLFTKER